MEGTLGRCRGILNLAFKNYWFRLDDRNGKLSYAQSKDKIKEPLLEVPLMLATVRQRGAKLTLKTFAGGELTLKASSEKEAERWTSKIREVIDGLSDYVHVQRRVDITERKKDTETEMPERDSGFYSSDFIEDDEELTDRVKDLAKKHLPTSMVVKQDKIIQEMSQISLVPRLEHTENLQVQMGPIQYVVSIDFGTTYSGYAYQHFSNFHTNKTGVYCKVWHGMNSFAGVKTSTTILLTKDGKFDSFGFEAQKKYNDLIEDGKQEGWKFFQRFKMSLFQTDLKGLSRGFQVRDDQNNAMPASLVFGYSIEFLKNDAFENINESDPGVLEENIFYVITIPAIWNESSQQFMMEAIELAGIDPSQAILAKEPEAAGIFCKDSYLKMQRENRIIKDKTLTFEQGSKFIVLDLGGGTTDIAVLEVDQNDNIKVLTCASGGPWGGTSVDKEFLSLIKEINGLKNFDEILQQHRSQYYDLLENWEVRKRAHTNKDEKCIVMLPPELNPKQSKQKLELNTSKGPVHISSNKMMMPLETFKSLTASTVQKLNNHLKEMSAERAFENVNTLFMVGGFSGSSFVQKAVRDAFPGVQIIVPQEGATAVLRGAVAYGFNPQIINARVSSHHYGIDERGKFKVLIKKNQNIPIGRKLTEYRTSLISDDDGFHINIYASDEVEAPEDTRRCRKMGEIFIRMLGKFGRVEKDVIIAIVFDNTEMKVEATDAKTNRAFITTCEFLN